MRGRPFLVTLLIAVDVLEMPATAGMAAGVVRFLPNLVIALVVWMVGRLLAHFMAQAVPLDMKRQGNAFHSLSGNRREANQRSPLALSPNSTALCLSILASLGLFCRHHPYDRSPKTTRSD
jgi:hypothetical protein